MLVDLARNDLGKKGRSVRVEKLMKVEYFSHVMHLVSRVSAQVSSDQNRYELLADSFPAGTLSGAPKYKAMQLIDQYEPSRRGLYGGAIGFIGFDGSVNHAIFIRSAICKDSNVHYRAGAGIVVDSVPSLERHEVVNKTDVIRHAMQMASQTKTLVS